MTAVRQKRHLRGTILRTVHGSVPEAVPGDDHETYPALLLRGDEKPWCSGPSSGPMGADIPSCSLSSLRWTVRCPAQ